MSKAKAKAKKTRVRPAQKVYISEFSITGLRMGEKTKETIQAKADKYAHGNFSAWLRYAGQKFVPKKDEKIPQEIA
jgi:FlaA1/EpsC-like NDP-sugar epimerase